MDVVDPTAVAFGSHGYLFVADQGAPPLPGGPPGSPPAIVRFDLQTGMQTLITSAGLLETPAAMMLVPEPNAGLLLASGIALLALLGRHL